MASIFSKLAPFVAGAMGFNPGFFGLGSWAGAGGLANAAAAFSAVEGLTREGDDRGIGALQKKMEKWNEGPAQQEGWNDNLYASIITGAKFSTAEERDAYDKAIRSRQVERSVNKQIATPLSGIQRAAAGGLIQGPGNITSDSIPGTVRQGGVPVNEIAVSNGEVIMSGRDLAALDPSGNQARAGMRLGGAANGSRGAEAARMFSEVQRMRG